MIRLPFLDALSPAPMVKPPGAPAGIVDAGFIPKPPLPKDAVVVAGAAVDPNPNDGAGGAVGCGALPPNPCCGGAAGANPGVGALAPKPKAGAPTAGAGAIVLPPAPNMNPEPGADAGVAAAGAVAPPKLKAAGAVVEGALGG
mmetsp:Transcript_23302/g.46561  ORF Transcript_23302/g.46561 Transcript_23302/m.46561 type:complete len:143 (+) Transcript_23302:83-511(+)